MSPYMASSIARYLAYYCVIVQLFIELVIAGHQTIRLKRKLKGTNCAPLSITSATSTMVTTLVIYATVTVGIGQTIILLIRSRLKKC